MLKNKILTGFFLALCLVVLSAYQPARRGFTSVQATVLNGQTTSTEIDTRGYSLYNLYIPSTFDGTDLKLQCSFNDTSANFIDLFDDAGNQALFSNSGTFQVAASRAVGIKQFAVPLGACRFIRIVTTTSQTGDTDFRWLIK